MIPLVTEGFVPAPVDAAPAAIADLLGRLETRLRGDGLGSDRVVSLTWFALGGDLDATAAHVRSAVAGRFGEAPPPSTVVAEPPSLGALALEATWVHPAAAGAEVHRVAFGGTHHTLLRQGAVRQLHAGGDALCAQDPAPADRAARALAQAAGVLAVCDMDFGHVVRQWNTLGGMLARGPDDRQGYQVFNDARTRRYAGCEFPHGYPAATGIGQAAPRTQVELIAIEGGDAVFVQACSNPEQVDAHCYSAAVLPGAEDPELHAKTPPKFERAQRVRSPAGETVLVSGTASIVGEASVAVGDVVGQTRTTLGHIERLLEGREPTHLRVYVKRAGDIPAVRNVCQAAHGRVPTLYVVADVCRAELLVEIEAAHVEVGAGV